MRKAILIVMSMIALTTCGGGGADNDQATQAPDETVIAAAVEQTIAAQAPTATTEPTATSTQVPATATTPPKPTETPKPSPAPRPTATPRPTVTPAPPTATPVPPLPLSTFQPTVDELGATYNLDSVDDNREEKIYTRGLVKSERMSYVIELSEMDSAPDILQLVCRLFDDPDFAAEWMTKRRGFLNSYLVNPENETAIETASDEAYAVTGILPDGKSPPMYNAYVLYRLGVYTCEYSTWDFDDPYLQFIIDVANRVISRVASPPVTEDPVSVEPAQSAGDFMVENMNQMIEGRWEDRWQTMHPALQALVPLDVYLFCMNPIELSIDSMEIISEEPGVPDNYPEVGEVTVTRVTYKVTVDGVSDVFESHLLNVDGNWRWAMKDDMLNTFKQGQCPD